MSTSFKRREKFARRLKWWFLGWCWTVFKKFFQFHTFWTAWFMYLLMNFQIAAGQRPSFFFTNKHRSLIITAIILFFTTFCVRCRVFFCLLNWRWNESVKRLKTRKKQLTLFLWKEFGFHSVKKFKMNLLKCSSWEVSKLKKLHRWKLMTAYEFDNLKIYQLQHYCGFKFYF